MRPKFFCLFLILIVLISNSFAQDSTRVAPSQSEIKVIASLTKQEVPLNRTVTFNINIEWIGDLDNYEISEVENPELRNLKITQTSSADRRESVDGKLKAVKTFSFELQPEELGMGYIDGVIIKYIDKASGNGKHLITNRLQVKVIDPLPEPGSRNWIYNMIFLMLLASLLVLGIYFMWKKRQEKKQKLAEQQSIVPLEKLFLEDLKQNIPLNDPELNMSDSYTKISSMFRHYLSEKYGFHATNEIKEEIIKQLQQNGLSESLILSASEILDKCDVVKFSGGGGERSELERVYTLLEGFIESNLKSVVSVTEKDSDIS